MKDFTDITILLDRSQSMGSFGGEVVGTLNDFIAQQKEAGDNARLTLVQFDSVSIETIRDAVPINEVTALGTNEFQPRGCTPLLDALGQTIARTGERLKGIAETDRPDKVVFVVFTDGFENASVEFKKEAVNKMIGVQESVYKWQFVYLGANQDAFLEAAALGMAVANAATYTATGAGLKLAGQIVADNLVSYRGGRSTSMSFNTEQQEKLKRGS